MTFSLCAIKALTGFDCPGCGLTRSLLALLHGDVAGSIRYHPMGVPVLLLFIGWLGVRKKAISTEAKNWVAQSFLLGFFVPWIVHWFV